MPIMSTMSSLTIRPASPADLPAITALAQPAFEFDPVDAHMLREKLFEWTRSEPEAQAGGGPTCALARASQRPHHTRADVLLAEADGAPLGFMQLVQRPAAGRGWIGLCAVDRARRGAGVGRALFDAATAALHADIRELEVLAIPGNYFHPGLDPRYTEGLAFFERLGFERFKDCVNLRCDLLTAFETAEDEARLARSGVAIRRAGPADDPLLDAFFAQQFGDDWRAEVAAGMAQSPPAVHLALERGELIAFSAHSTQNRRWGFFGPMGTTPAARGKGLGRVLLRRCLNDLRDAGHATAVIPWVGPIAFYQRWAGCRVERVFWRYRRQRPASGGEHPHEIVI